MRRSSSKIISSSSRSNAKEGINKWTQLRVIASWMNMMNLLNRRALRFLFSVFRIKSSRRHRIIPKVGWGEVAVVIEVIIIILILIVMRIIIKSKMDKIRMQNQRDKANTRRKTKRMRNLKKWIRGSKYLRVEIMIGRKQLTQISLRVDINEIGTTITTPIMMVVKILSKRKSKWKLHLKNGRRTIIIRNLRILK